MIVRERLAGRRRVALVSVLVLAATCALLLAATASPATAAPSESTSGSNGIVLGVSTYPPVVPVIASLVAGAKAEAKKRGVSVRFGEATGAPAQQSAIDQLIAEGANVLAIDPEDSTAITTEVKKANKKNIPTIMLVGKSTGGKLATFIGSNELLGGKRVADYVAHLLHGHGEVALIQGDEVHQAFILRERGFRQELKKYPGLKLAAFGIGKQTAPPSETLARDMMTAHPHLKAIVALADAMAAGVYQAVQGLHKTKSVAVIGYNGDCPTLRSIWQGKIDATVFQNWYGFGVEAVDAAIAVHDGLTLPPNEVEPIIVLNRDVMQQVRQGKYASKDPSLEASVSQAITNTCPKA